MLADKRERGKAETASLLPAALFIIAILPSAFHGNADGAALLINQLAGFSACLLVSRMDKERTSRIIDAITAAGAGIAVIALYQYFYGFGHLAEYMAKNEMSGGIASDYLGSKRVFAPFVTSNALAGFLAMVIPLRMAGRKTALPSLLLIIPAFLLAKSLGAAAALFCGTLLFFSLSRNKFRKTALAVLLLAGVFIAAVFVLRSTGSQSPGFSLHSRLAYWKEIALIIKNSPVCGNGAGNCAGSASSFAHNLFLQLWCELGIPGTAAFAWFIISTAGKACAHIRRSGDDNYLLIFCAWTIFLVHNLADFTFFLPQISFIWWLIGGILISKPDLTKIPAPSASP
ncbi:MAG: O-antigen ligase family protein [Candidatus Omnitrophica bacterium]|nr:O-antigen ligase family protein [Candidatus Omnitrophota bacterium]